MKISLTISLDTDRDRDVIRWLERQDNKSAAIRETIRAHLQQGDVTLADVYHAIQDLKRCGLAFSATSTDLADEPPDVAAALDTLGL